MTRLSRLRETRIIIIGCSYSGFTVVKFPSVYSDGVPTSPGRVQLIECYYKGTKFEFFLYRHRIGPNGDALPNLLSNLKLY